MNSDPTWRPPQRTILIGTSLGDNPVPHHFAALGRELTNAGYGVSLLVHGPNNDRSYVDPRISVLRWPSSRPIGLADARFFARVLRAHPPSCVISNFGSVNVMTMVGALLRVPVRLIWHHTLSDQNLLDARRGRMTIRLQMLRARIVWRLATHLVANSNAARQDLVEAFCIPTSRCRVFWNCLEDPIGPGKALPVVGPENKRNFVCVGRFARSKGQDIVVRAVAAVVQHVPDIKVEFIGGGKSRETCATLAAELGVAKQCSFSGSLRHGDVLKQMASARATIVPSRAEAFGLVCIESMAVGVPVIGSRTGGIAEVVREGIDGLLFAPEDHQALARQMIEITENDLFCRRMAAACRQRFLENFELSKAVAAQARWLDALISSSEGSGAPLGACDSPPFEEAHGPGDSTRKSEGG